MAGTKWIDVIKPLGATLTIYAGATSGVLADNSGNSAITWNSSEVILGKAASAPSLTLTGGSAGNGKIWYGSSAIQFGNNVGNVTDDGTWTFPTVTTHTFGANSAGRTTVSIDGATGAGNSAALRLQIGGVAKAYIQCSNTNEAIVGASASDLSIVAVQNMYFSTGGAGVNHGSCVSGAWTLGPVGNNSHIINGLAKFRNNSSADGGICLSGIETGSTSRFYAWGADSSTFGILEFYAAKAGNSGVFYVGGYDGSGAWKFGPDTNNNAPLRTAVQTDSNTKVMRFGSNAAFSLASGASVTCSISTSINVGALVLITVGNSDVAATAAVLCGYPSTAIVLGCTLSTVISATTSPAYGYIGVAFNSTTGVLTIYGGALSSGSHSLRVSVFSQAV